MTILRSGEASLVGQVRPENQDNFVVAPDKQLFAVADGMGGHRGGEVASDVAAKALASAFTERSAEGLAHAVQASNDAVVTTADGDSSLKGMGTTLCALALVDGDGADRLAVANVGDSRLYLLRGGLDRLEQVTEDHSLVETLYRQGQLTKAEAEVHPHRNILTRALGIEADVLVDVFELLPVAGDRYLICSDGLFNEVTEEHMAIVLRRHDDPQPAAEELARLADEAGGRDNITVVIVDVLADPGTEAVPPDPELERVVKVDRASEQPIDFPSMGGTGPNAPRPPAPPPPAPADGRPTAPQPMVAGEDGQPVPAPGPVPAAAGGAATAVAPPVVVQPAPAAVPPPAAGPVTAPVRRTRFTWRVALFIVLILGVLAAIGYSFVFFANNTFYVGFQGENVTIFKGRPGGVLFIQPSVSEQTDIRKADVPKERLADLEKGKDEPSLAEAQSYISNLRDQIAKNRSLGNAVGGAEGGTTTTSVLPPVITNVPDTAPVPGATSNSPPIGNRITGGPTVPSLPPSVR